MMTKLAAKVKRDGTVLLGRTDVGRVRRCDTGEWTAAYWERPGVLEPLEGNYRRRDTAVEDVIAAWEAERVGEPEDGGGASTAVATGDDDR